MKIDIFAHIVPVKYKEALKSKAPSGAYQLDVIDVVTALSDLDMRFRVMDKHDDYLQVLTIGSPPVENIVGPKEAIELAKIANDEMAQLVRKYPDRFASAVACLPMNDVDAALKEADRTITELAFCGVQIFSDINGKPIDSPEFLCLYEKMADYDLPIWLHPRRSRTVPDYRDEAGSKYNIFSIFGWPYETSAAMTRLVFSGVLDKNPHLKVITHHCGGMIPYFEKRIEVLSDFDLRMSCKRDHYLTKRVVDYYRMFYNDTAVYGSTPALMCGYAFFGAEHILFGTDFPYDNQGGFRYIRETIHSVEEMSISDSDKRKIFEENAKELLRLPI